MPIIRITTEIKAPQSVCFDLSRSVELHLESTSETQERVVAGRQSGLFKLGDMVTWEAVHLGIKQQLTVKITDMRYPDFFEDEMVKGAFFSMQHKHFFSQKGELTIMRDEFMYRSPLGVMGQLADVLFLKRYLTRFLLKRNACIKKLAEEHGFGTLSSNSL